MRLLDVRWSLASPDGSEAYAAAHLPAAVYVSLETELSAHGEPIDGRHPLPSRSELEAAARRWGSQATIDIDEAADLILAGSPVYKGSYTGLFKYVLDLVDQYALVDVSVVVVATGGSERHQLVIDHQLRPLFSFFQTATNSIGIYAHTSDFDKYEIASPALRSRIARAAEKDLVAVSSSRSLREVNSAAL